MDYSTLIGGSDDDPSHRSDSLQIIRTLTATCGAQLFAGAEA